MEVEIIRSEKRKRTISAREIDGMIRLYLPRWFSSEEESKYIQWAKKRFDVRRRRKEIEDKNKNIRLERKAGEFNRKYFNGELTWNRIAYSTQQNAHMFGNCSLRNRTIRISDRLLGMPRFVHDYVLVHELAHLKVHGHNKTFWDLVNRYPKTERARGYLMALGREKNV